MKLEEQACSLELGKKLKELGVKQDSLFFYEKDSDEIIPSFGAGNDDYYEYNFICSAFTTSELGEILPDEVFSEKSYGSWIACRYEDYTDCVIDLLDADTETDARAKLLIYLIEEGIITP